MIASSHFLQNFVAAHPVFSLLKQSYANDIRNDVTRDHAFGIAAAFCECLNPAPVLQVHCLVEVFVLFFADVPNSVLLFFAAFDCTLSRDSIQKDSGV